MLERFTQQSHPKLWLIFHAMFGAPRDKKRIALSYLLGRKSILEIGCSLGVVADAFREHASVRYLGIDIDEQAIRHAQSRFVAFPHMKFEARSLESVSAEGLRFDYVLFGNILHHVNDDLAKLLLQQAINTVSKDGLIVIMEPDIQHPEDGPLLRFLYELERGEYRRPLGELVKLAEGAGIRLVRAERQTISIGLLPGIVGGRMLVLSGAV